MSPIPWLVDRLLRYGLHRTFRRVYWMGPWPPRLPKGPVIAYANHHHYYDGHLGWLLFQEHLGRPTTLWMAEWHRFPFFGAVGAQPFPPDDPSARAATVRRTARRFQKDPQTVLLYYPEGELRRPDDGLGSFSTSSERMARLYPSAAWWPLAVHVTWNGHAAPTAYLRGGPPHAADGSERKRLARHWAALKGSSTEPTHVLLDGTPDAGERWSFSVTAPFFRRYL